MDFFNSISLKVEEKSYKVCDMSFFYMYYLVHVMYIVYIFRFYCVLSHIICYKPDTWSIIKIAEILAVRNEVSLALLPLLRAHETLNVFNLQKKTKMPNISISTVGPWYWLSKLIILVLTDILLHSYILVLVSQ